MLARAIAWVTDVIPSITWVLIASELLIFAPMTFIGKMRNVAQFGFALSAALLSFMLWFSSAVEIYAYHGLLTLILATLFLAIPTVFIAGFESIVHHDWYSLVGMIVMIAAIAGALFGFGRCEGGCRE